MGRAPGVRGQLLYSALHGARGRYGGAGKTYLPLGTAPRHEADEPTTLRGVGSPSGW